MRRISRQVSTRSGISSLYVISNVHHFREFRELWDWFCNLAFRSTWCSCHPAVTRIYTKSNKHLRDIWKKYFLRSLYISIWRKHINHLNLSHTFEKKKDRSNKTRNRILNDNVRSNKGRNLLNRIFRTCFGEILIYETLNQKFSVIFIHRLASLWNILGEWRKFQSFNCNLYILYVLVKSQSS